MVSTSTTNREYQLIAQVMATKRPPHQKETEWKWSLRSRIKRRNIENMTNELSVAFYLPFQLLYLFGLRSMKKLKMSQCPRSKNEINSARLLNIVTKSRSALVAMQTLNGNVQTGVKKNEHSPMRISKWERKMDGHEKKNIKIVIH